jgi:hypothetical protein
MLEVFYTACRRRLLQRATRGGIFLEGVGGSHLLQVDKVGNRSPSSWSQARNRGRPLDTVAGGVQGAMSSSPS